ncbi:MAG: hypothetical protein WDA06_00985 [Phenylobacterium sp.]
MPYIKEERKNELDVNKEINSIAKSLKDNNWGTGDFNYVISRIAWLLVKDNISYKTLSKARAAMNDASIEFYRRLMADYEDKKAEENGDVFI